MVSRLEYLGKVDLSPNLWQSLHTQNSPCDVFITEWIQIANIPKREENLWKYAFHQNNYPFVLFSLNVCALCGIIRPGSNCSVPHSQVYVCELNALLRRLILTGFCYIIVNVSTIWLGNPECWLWTQSVECWVFRMSLGSVVYNEMGFAVMSPFLVWHSKVATL